MPSTESYAAEALCSPDSPKDILFVCGFPQYYTVKDVRELLEQWGTVKDVFVYYLEEGSTPVW